MKNQKVTNTTRSTFEGLANSSVDGLRFWRFYYVDELPDYVQHKFYERGLGRMEDVGIYVYWLVRSVVGDYGRKLLRVAVATSIRHEMDDRKLDYWYHFDITDPCFDNGFNNVPLLYDTCLFRVHDLMQRGGFEFRVPEEESAEDHE